MGSERLRMHTIPIWKMGKPLNWSRIEGFSCIFCRDKGSSVNFKLDYKKKKEGKEIRKKKRAYKNDN